MAIVYTNQKSKNKNKKPGWEKEKAEYDAWLKKINSVQLFSSPKPKKFTNKTINPVRDTTVPVIPDSRKVAHTLPSKVTTIKGGTIKYVNPAVLYKEDPEMLDRELKARERKFNTAPAYNKGPAQFMSDEDMKDVKAGSTRRR